MLRIVTWRYGENSNGEGMMEWWGAKKGTFLIRVRDDVGYAFIILMMFNLLSRIHILIILHGEH